MRADILKVRVDGQWVGIPALQGEKGQAGSGSGDMEAAVYDPAGKKAQVAAVSDIPTRVSALANDAGYLTVHQDISGKLDKNGDGSNVTAAFSKAQSRQNLASGETLAVAFGKIAAWLAGLGTAAFTASTAYEASGAVSSAVSAHNAGASAHTTLFAGKADVSHAHAVSDVTGLSGELAKKYSSANPPPYPVTSVAGKTGAVTAAQLIAAVGGIAYGDLV